MIAARVAKLMPRETTSTIREPNRPRIVEGILEGIFSGKYSPGDRLVSSSLAKEFGVSQTPIREALGTLSGMGVLSVKPNCGAVVRRFAPREVRDICQVRRAMECLAITTACGRIPRKSLESLHNELTKQSKLRGTIGRQAIEDVKRTDTQLHDLIREHTRNRFLNDELERIMILVRAIRDAAWNRLLKTKSPDLVFVIQEAKEHLAIVDALILNDTKLAKRALSDHLRSGTRYIVRAVED